MELKFNDVASRTYDSDGVKAASIELAGSTNLTKVDGNTPMTAALGANLNIIASPGPVQPIAAVAVPKPPEA